MPEHDDSTQPPVNIGTKDDRTAEGRPADAAADIMPPEQPPMDDAAGGPQAEDADAPMPGEKPVEGAQDPQIPTEGRAAGHTSEAHPS